MNSSPPTASCPPKFSSEFTEQGFWTPMTTMFQAIKSWCATHPLPVSAKALSIDRNPKLDDIVLHCWPDLQVERAIHPPHDVQRLTAFGDNQYDFVYSNQVLEHLPKPWLAGEELVRVLKPGGIGLHTTCAFNPLHGPPHFNDYYRFLPDGLAELFPGVTVLVKAGWGNREALIYNLTADDGFGAMGGRRFHPLVGQRNDPTYPWHTWIIFQKKKTDCGPAFQVALGPSVAEQRIPATEGSVGAAVTKEQALVRALVGPGMTVFDVGANSGKYTKLFSALVGKTGKVFAFESLPHSQQLLRQLLVNERLANVVRVDNALSEPSGTAVAEPVTLDGFCEKGGITQVDYLKLEVAGGEFRALQGASGLLDRQAIRFLQLAVSQTTSTQAQFVFNLLDSFGYECHAISSDGNIAGVVTDLTGACENYLAIPARLKGVDEAFAANLLAALQHPDHKRRVWNILSSLEKAPTANRYLDAGPWFDPATLLNCLARHGQPENYLEIGGCGNESLAQVLMESPTTNVFGLSAGISSNGSAKASSGPALVAETTRPDLDQRLQLQHGALRETIPAFFSQPGNPQTFDLIRVDGGQLAEGARFGLETAFAHLAPGGALIFGDICDPAHHELAMLWDEFAQHYPDFLFINDLSGLGTGVMFRPPFQRLAAQLASPEVSEPKQPVPAEKLQPKTTVQAEATGRPPPRPAEMLAETRRELALAFDKHNGPGYLAPTDLSAGGGSPKRWLLLGSCLAYEWVRGFTEKCPGDFISVTNVAELPELPPQPIEAYDFQIIQLLVRNILADWEMWKLPYDDEAAHVALFQEACARLEQQLAARMAWNRKYGLLTFVANFMLPQQNPLGRLLPRYDYRNPVYFFEKLNEFLSAKVTAYPNAYLLDLDQISAAFGRKFIQEDSVFWLAHGSYLPDTPEDLGRLQAAPSLAEYYPTSKAVAYEAVWAEITAMYRTLRSVNSVKLVVVDLDDTLWKGVIGELSQIDYDQGYKLIAAEHAAWPMGMIEALWFLKKRGVLLAIISKNDEAKIREVWPKVFGRLLELDQFAAVKINWQPKAENMREILEQTNLLSRNVVFVDDNPVERAAMQAAFPDVRALSGLHYYWKRSLLWSAETQVAAITSESVRRTQMVQAQVARESDRQALSREEFLNTLDLSVELAWVQSIEDPHFARAFELINKSNQFNTTGKRWRQEECRAAFQHGCVFHIFSAADKFCQYGLVGVAIRSGSHLDQFVMSCRVSGLDVEIAALGEVVRAARNDGFDRLTAALTKTDANFLCQNFFRSCAFEEKNGSWELTSGEHSLAPSHIKLVSRPAPASPTKACPVAHVIPPLPQTETALQPS